MKAYKFTLVYGDIRNFDPIYVISTTLSKAMDECNAIIRDKYDLYNRPEIDDVVIGDVNFKD